MNPLPPPPAPPPLPRPPSSSFPPMLPPSSTFPPPPHHFHHPTPTSIPAYDLPSALSSLTSLLNLSSTTLHSLSSLLPIPLIDPSPTLIPCPFNPNHRLPLSSLFSHSLHCPRISSSSADYIQTLIQNLKYPQTLQSSNQFTLPLRESQSDLCFSLETYLDFENTNFFYSNCPGVVSFPIRGENDTPPMLTLPAVLSSECANSGHDLMMFPKEIIIKLLPSEVYAIRNETDSWNEFPLCIPIVFFVQF